MPATHAVCDDWTDLQFDHNALETIATRVQRIDSEPFIGPVFDDQQAPGLSRTTDTGNVRFRTTLRFWYDNAEHSELNAARLSLRSGG